MHLTTILTQLANNYPLSLSETPGGVYAVAYWLGAMLFIIVNRKKLKLIPFILISLLTLASLVAFMELNHPVPAIWFIPSILAYVFLLFIFAKLRQFFFNSAFCTSFHNVLLSFLLCLRHICRLVAGCAPAWRECLPKFFSVININWIWKIIKSYYIIF